METKLNTNGIAILNVLKENKGKVLTFAEIADMAGIEAKTGYLTAAKKLAADNKAEIVKRDNAVTAKVKTVTVYPNGLTIEKEKDVTFAGYELIEA